MAATQTRPPEAPLARPTAGGSSSRTVKPRRGLPGGRAVVGGFLVAVAAVGIFATVSGAGRGPDTRYVVADRALRPGAIVSAGDLRQVPIELPSEVAQRSFHEPGQLVGAVVLAPLEEGELVQASGLGDAGEDGIPTVAVSVDAADGFEGGLRPGDRVDVYVSFGSAIGSSTRLIVPNAEVTAGSTADATVGNAGQVTVTLAVDDPTDRLELINGAHAGKLTLVRITGAAEGGKEDTFVPKPLEGETGGTPAAGGGAAGSGGSDG